MGEDESVLTDEEIAGLSPDERRHLIARLARPIREVTPGQAALLPRSRFRIGVVTASLVLLVPWVIYLASALPRVHRVRNWDLLWVGFDVIELVLLAVTLWLGVRRRLLVVLSAFATGVVLLCDAWFDVMTANPGELWKSVLAAVLLEGPLALLLMSAAVRMIRTGSALLWLIDPGEHVWEIPLPRVRGSMPPRTDPREK